MHLEAGVLRPFGVDPRHALLHSIAAYFGDAACRRGEKALCFAFEESPDRIIRTMRFIGPDLEEWGVLPLPINEPHSLQELRTS